MIKTAVILSFVAVCSASSWNGMGGMGSWDNGHNNNGYDGHNNNGHNNNGHNNGYDNHDISHPIPYAFGYDVKDDHGLNLMREEKSDGHGSVHGSYAYRDGHGIHRHVEYVADKNGFRARVKTNEPGTARSHPADVDMNADPIITHSWGHGNNGNNGGHGNNGGNGGDGGYGKMSYGRNHW